MPEIRDWWEQEFEEEQSTKTTVGTRTGRKRSPGVGTPERPRGQPPDPCEALLAYAERLPGRLDSHASPCHRPEPKLLRHLAHLCRERSDLLDDRAAHVYAGALVALSAHWRDWLRTPYGWEPAGEDAGEQFGSLARHLFALNEVPAFLDAAWRAGLTAEGVRHQGWFKHVGCGGNIRTADDLPMPVTKRMAHHFARAPLHLAMPSALRWAQVMGSGGDERLAQSVLASRIATDFRDDDFWVTVFRWLSDHPSVAPPHHGPVIDFLYDRRFVPSVANPSSRVRGQPRQPILVPPQPNLCMKGRTPDSLLRAVEEWHRKLGSERKGSCTEWKPSGIKPFSHDVGEGADRQVYAVTELISSVELEEEGRAMGHCVASYWALCASGQTSIWSVTVEDATGHVTRLLTLEVRGTQREVVQARGRSNVPASARGQSLLARWAEDGGPSLCRWLLGEPMEEF